MKCIKLIFAMIPTLLFMNSLAFAQDTTLTVTSSGNVGIGTSAPLAKLHVVGDPGNTLRLEGSQPYLVLNTDLTFQSGISFQANGARKWSIFTDTGGFSKNNLSFRDADAGVTRLFIDPVGNVGIGTTGPGKRLEVHSGGDFINTRFTSSSIASVIAFHNSDVNSDLVMIGAQSTDLRFITNGTDRVAIKNNGRVGIGTLNPQGTLDVNGSIFQRGGQLHADYVFEPDYRLETIEGHAEFMWNHKHLKAIPKAKADAKGREVVEVGAHRKGIVEELEKAHIYIEQLHNRIKTLETTLNNLVSRLDGGE